MARTMPLVWRTEMRLESHFYLPRRSKLREEGFSSDGDAIRRTRGIRGRRRGRGRADAARARRHVEHLERACGDVRAPSHCAYRSSGLRPIVARGRTSLDRAFR